MGIDLRCSDTVTYVFAKLLLLCKTLLFLIALCLLFCDRQNQSDNASMLAPRLESLLFLGEKFPAQPNKTIAIIPTINFNPLLS